MALSVWRSSNHQEGDDVYGRYQEGDDVYGHLNERALPDLCARFMVTERCRMEGYDEFRTQLVINPFKMEATRYLADYHHKLLEYSAYAVARYKSEVYFLGGVDIRAFQCSNKVFVKAPGSGWEEVNDMPPMQSPRAFHKSIVVNDKLYVFGCAPGFTFNVPALPPHEWAECYDFKSKKWTYLPEPPLAACGCRTVRAITHLAACYKILVWVSLSPGVFAYDYVNQNWTTIPLPINISPVSDRSSSCENGSSWYGNVVAVGNVVIWYLKHIIYVYDVFQSCVIKQFVFKISPDFAHDGSSYFYSLGDGMLFLLLWNASNMFFYATFSYDKNFNIYQEDSAFIPTSAAYGIEAPWACVLIP